MIIEDMHQQKRYDVEAYLDELELLGSPDPKLRERIKR